MIGKDLAGEVFGRWTVVKEAACYVSPKGKKLRRWLCVCECDEQRFVLQCHLVSGKSISCGCFHSDVTIGIFTIHGASHTTEFYSWSGMLARCHNPNNPSYPRYGGRGITVCLRWRNSFKAFLDDMGLKPSPRHSIDRINNDKGYSPANCKWSTPSEQNSNQRKRVIYRGKPTRFAPKQESK